MPQKKEKQFELKFEFKMTMAKQLSAPRMIQKK